MDHRSRLPSGDQGPVRVVSSVCKELEGDPDAETGSDGFQFFPVRSGKDNEDQISIHTGKNLCNGFPDGRIFNRHIIEGAMGFHVLEFQTLHGGECVECPHLIGNVVFDLVQGGVHVASAEAHQIRESGVGAQSNTVLLCKRDGLPHDRGIARMKSAGDVGRADQGDDRLIQPEFVVAEALTDIGVQINFVHNLSPNASLWPQPNALRACR